MEQSTLVLIIVGIVIILYATEKLPLSVTTILAMTAFVIFNVLTPEESFAGFSSTATLLLIAMSIIGEAFLTSGLVSRTGKILSMMTKIPLSMFLSVIFLTGAILSAFLNGLAVVAIFMPILAALEQQTNEKIPLKYTLMPLAIGAVLGGNLTIVGSTSMINASNILGTSYYGKSLPFFAPTMAALPSVIVTFFFYMFFGQKFQKKCFDFNKSSLELTKNQDDIKQASVWKSVFMIVVLLFCIIGFAKGFNLILISFTGALLVLISGCITTKQAYSAISWETIFVISGASGFAKGIEKSGAGEIIANAVVHFLGPVISTAFGLCIVTLVLSTILSNFMSNNISVTIIAPMVLAVSEQLGYDPLPLILACGIGVNLSLATPVCTACITMTTSAGYRFKDYLKVGGVVNLLSVIATAIALYILYYK